MSCGLDALARVGLEGEGRLELELGVGGGLARDVGREARTLSPGLRRPTRSSRRRTAPSSPLTSRIGEPFDLPLGHPPGLVEAGGLQDVDERPGDVPADDGGLVDRRRRAVVQAEAEEVALGRPFLVGLADVAPIR